MKSSKSLRTPREPERLAMGRSSSSISPKLFEFETMITANRLSDGNPSRIREEFVSSGDAMAALAERTAQVDQLVLAAATTLLFPAVRCEVAVLAVGGYGRRQLF